MRVEKSVKKAIDEWMNGDAESSMLHACNAVDGTAKKIWQHLGNKKRMINFIRDNYDIIGPMGMPGIDLDAGRFPVNISDPTTTDGRPDLADVIYTIHRCTHAHGDELPFGYELYSDVKGAPRCTQISVNVKEASMRLSDRIIFALLSAVVFSPVNKNLNIGEPYFLTYGSVARMYIDEWWGKKTDFMNTIIRLDPPPEKIVLNF